MGIRTNIRTVAVFGAGQMGAGIAQVFAQSGRTVLLQDAAPGAVERGIAGIGKSLEKLASKGKIAADVPAATVARIRPASLGDAKSADLIIEAIIENAEIKKKLFSDLNTIVSNDVVFASNTSSISISELGAGSGRPTQFIGMHFFNPVPLMQLVEVVIGLQTADAVIELTTNLAKEVGKIPHRVKDHPGFVSNRVLMPLINEAISALQDGVADATTIDEVMKLGCNHPMGPLALADLIGLDTCLYIMEVLHRDLGDDRYRPTPLLRTMVRAGLLGRKSRKGFHTYE
jgi:3-hydroxybutyryl-CoA dehydrogenase